MNIDVTMENLDFFQCFSSKSKIKIIELLGIGPQNIGDLAKNLDVSSTIVTRHISEMENAGIVISEMISGKRGQQKVCSLAVNKVVLNFIQQEKELKTTSMNIPIGQFSSFQVEPTCGLASTEKYIGIVDDPRYFESPEAITAGILWFKSGYIEYTIPSYIFDHAERIKSLVISFEICSEYPHYNNEFPSDILFTMNSTELGYWTSPGSFGGKKGLYTPEWFTCGTEFGLLKRLMINREGTFIDGERISDINISELGLGNNKNQVLRISSPKDVAHPGGVTIFGKGFGNHAQDISITVNYL